MANPASGRGAAWLRARASALRRLFHLLLKEQRASLVVPTALMLPVLLIVLGTGVDYLNLTRIRSELQSAADAAAIAGARQFAVSGIKEDQIREVASLVASQSVDTANGSYQIETAIDGETTTVGVSLEQEWTPFFAHFLKTGITPVKERAKASFLGTANICVLALDRTAL